MLLNLMGEDEKLPVAGRVIWVTPKGVEVRKDGGGPLFYRTPAMRPLVVPADTGDIERLRRYVNLPDRERWLLIGFAIYFAYGRQRSHLARRNSSR